MAKVAMNEKQIIKLAMICENESLKSIGDKIGVNYKTIANQLRRDNTLTLSSFFLILNAIGFEIVVRKKDDTKRDNEYVLREITESEAEWEKNSTIEIAEAKFKKIDQAEIDRIKADTSNKAEPRKAIQPLPTKKMK